MTHRILIITTVVAAVVLAAGWLLPVSTPALPESAAIQTPPAQTPHTNPTPSQTISSPPAVQTYTLADVAQHNSAASCWSAINGKVYDLTSWINQHPGGPEHILGICGEDGSAAFNDQHGGQGQPAQELATFYIGDLAQ